MTNDTKIKIGLIIVLLLAGFLALRSGNIFSPAALLLSPNGGETFEINQTITIRWTAGSPGIRLIEFAPVSGGSSVTIYQAAPFSYPVGDTSGSYSFNPSLSYRLSSLSGSYYIRIYPANSSAYEQSVSPVKILPGVSSVSVSVTFPNGGETFIQGKQFTISWSGGKNIVQVGVTRGIYSSPADIIGWISVKNHPDSSLIWDGLKTCDLNMSSCLPLAPGSYKILVVSEDENGNLCAGCNDDFSNSPFTLSSSIPISSTSLTPLPTGTITQTSTVAPPSMTPAPLPSSVTITGDATKSIIAEVADGAKVVIPPLAALSSGTVTVAIKVAVVPPSESGIELAGAVYNVEVKDRLSKVLKDLTGEIEIILPYSESNLKKFGVGEDKVFPAYYDEAKGEWVKIGNYTQDKTNNLITARVRHLTRFAIVAPADITPPQPPTEKKIKLLPEGGVNLSWINPVRDFHSVKIYRSQTLGKFGSIMSDDITAVSVNDEDVAAGKTYYYLIRAVDPAGNESQNTTQLKIVVVTQPKNPEVKTPSQPIVEPPAKTSEEVKKEAPSPAPAEQPLPPVQEKPRGFFQRLWEGIKSLFGF